jgi:hypothetical protein
LEKFQFLEEKKNYLNEELGDGEGFGLFNINSSLSSE